MRSVGSLSTSGREKEGKRESTGRINVRKWIDLIEISSDSRIEPPICIGHDFWYLNTELN